MNSTLYRLLTAVAMGVVCALAAQAAQAAITIVGTRVVYPAQERQVSVRLDNVDDHPVLVQAWLDTGDASAAPNEIKVPFVLLPSIFRVEPHRGQAMRIMFTGGEMPTDREVVYWLNVLEIPPVPPDADQRSMIQLAFRTRIKMFYRPASLTETPTAQIKQLKWSEVANDKGQWRIRLDNPSPYYISIGRAVLTTGARTLVLQPEMAPPFGHVDLVPVAGKIEPDVPGTLTYSVLSDYGAAEEASTQFDGAPQAKANNSH
ncbi:fimbria/pilus periplasmic chaperone [Burkholderia glumae]|uniref:fimbria/pilus periplasmic chaperone n=1 Tax=Burkholderia glumae TaxID=337 RepID=UPI0021514F0D|nr:fimbria/pilus periplasmic chaperone [Burkholderia glumae]UVS97810.1 pilus assembly protein [Burkholderia glumae]